MRASFIKQCILCVFFAAAALFTGVLPAQAQQGSLTPVQRASWAQKLTNLIPSSLEGTRTIQDLAALPANDVYTVLSENWPNLSNSDIKTYILNSVLQNDNDRVLDILQLGISDGSLIVQNRALQFAENFGFDNFTEDFAAYQAWHSENAGKPLKAVIEASMRATVLQLPLADEAKRSALFNILVRTNFTATSQTSRLRRDAAISEKLPQALAPWLKQQNNLMWTAFQIVRNVHPTEEYLRKEIMPLTDIKTDTAVRYQALSTLGAEQNSWAIEPLMKMMLAEYPDPSSEIIGQTLSQIGDPKIIPTFISLMQTDNTPEGNRVLGNILSPLTGVTNAFVRDTAWWKTWWDKNKARFAPDVRALPFPKLAVRQRPVQGQNQNAFQEPRRPTLHQIANDPKRAYWFVDPKPNGRIANGGIRRILPMFIAAQIKVGRPDNPPPVAPDVQPPPPPNAGAHAVSAPGLIVVLTSDGDAASAAGFWYDVATKALDGKYYVAVVAAPKWMENQQYVWVTDADMKSVKDAKFSTETLVADVVKDAESTYTIDPSRVFLHGFGMGGAATYSASLSEKTPFHGFYILASTFRSASLPPADRANGRRYLIQNSKDDHVHPYWMAEAALKILAQKGAVVKLDSSNGYMGSQPNDAALNQIRASIDWLASGK